VEKDQERKVRNFDPKTGKKINPTCAFCWVKKIENYNCGFEECPGFDLPRIEKMLNAGRGHRKNEKREKESSNVNSLSTVLWYADNKIRARELNLVLTNHDWCEFEKQPFYPEFIQFLRSTGIQESKEKKVEEKTIKAHIVVTGLDEAEAQIDRILKKLEKANTLADALAAELIDVDI